MAIKINNTTIIDDSRNIVNAGVVTATSFSGSGAGLTGVSGIASNTSINTSGIVTASSFVGNLTGTASTATAAGTAYGLAGSPNVTVGVITATTISTGSTTGTSGQVLQSTGVGVTWKDPAAGGFSNMQVFTSPGTFTVPSTTTKVKVIVTGGGGGGTPSTQAGNGGNAGGTGIAIINIPGSTSVPVTVGASGITAPISAPVNNGGSSSFGSYVTATGGSNANYNTTNGTATFPQPAPTYQSKIAISGGSGAASGGTPPWGSKYGGSSYWGSGGNYPNSAYGSGGGVFFDVSNILFDGGPGVVVVEW